MHEQKWCKKSTHSQIGIAPQRPQLEQWLLAPSSFEGRNHTQAVCVEYKLVENPAAAVVNWEIVPFLNS
jgi:hypothetical protein